MFDAVRSFSNHRLLADTDAIVVQDRKLTLKLLVHLHEIERRKLYLEQGYGSMFDYCRSRLKLSEGAAMRRIRTARCLSRYPELHGLMESGEVNLMSVALISRVIKPGNAELLIARIRGKSKREVEVIIAELEPRALIPADRVKPVMVPVVPKFTTATGGGEKSSSASAATDGTDSPAPSFERRHVVQFTARDEFMAKVERARALYWHQYPNPTFEQLFELGLDALISRKDPEERQKRRETRRQKRAGASARSATVHAGRYVSASVRDQVFARSGFRCSFVGPDGRRCTATVALQVDHVKPVARGGASAPENLRILCAEHNRFEAERLMGPYKPSHAVQ
jgi:5-methylcytosine-specific restriction endonuclease McrA